MITRPKPKPRIIADPPPRVPGPVIFTPIRPFVVSDLRTLQDHLSMRDRQPFERDAAPSLVDLLNDGVNAFLAQVRRDRANTADETTKWNRKVEAKARELLAALGVRPIYPPLSFSTRPPIDDEMPAEIIFALSAEDSNPMRSYLNLPVSFNDAVRHLIGAVWYLAHVSGQAAAMHDGAKKRGQGERRKRVPDSLDALERFLLHLAIAYEKLSSKKLPKNVYGGASPHPFVRFCQSAFRMIAARAPKFADALEPADIAAFKALRKVKVSAIQADVASRVYERLNRKRSS